VLCNVDADGDGFGTSTTAAVSSCADAGVADNADDCDDQSAEIHPGATETTADGIDQDCDGNDICFEDLDGDGYGGVRRLATSCAAEGLVGRDGDCNESDATLHPGAEEIPLDGIDQDCDGGDACFADMDGDTFGTATTVVSEDLDCTDPGEANGEDDCLDSGADAAATFPGAAPKDSGTECMTDADDDGYGSATPTEGVASGSDHCDADATTTCILHVGYDEEFPGASVHFPGYVIGCRVAVTSAMTVTDLAVIGKAAGANVRMALYNHRFELVVEAASTPMVEGVIEVPVDPTPIDADSHWIMVVYDDESWVGTTWDSPRNDCVYWELSLSWSFSDPFPDPSGKPYSEDAVFNHYIVGY
jgi:hypothetical protein